MSEKSTFYAFLFKEILVPFYYQFHILMQIMSQ